MTRVLADPRGARWTRSAAHRDRPARRRSPRSPATRPSGSPLVVGLARVARAGEPRAVRVRLIAVVAVVSLLVFAPWAVRNWAVFGNPLPGQAISNALSVTGLRHLRAGTTRRRSSRYLAAGPAGAARDAAHRHRPQPVQRPAAAGHPDVGHRPARAAVAGSRPGGAAGPAREPSSPSSSTSLLFPVATTWGTFLHAAAPVHVLLLLSALGALDAGIARLGRRLGWTRPVAWLGPAARDLRLARCSRVALLPSFGGGARATERQYDVLARQMAAIGAPLDDTAPVIHDFPIWLAETARVRSLALPDESPSDVLDLANQFGARGSSAPATTTARGPRSSTARTRPPRASRRSCCRSPTTRRTPRRSRASACSGSSAGRGADGLVPRRGVAGARREPRHRYTPRDGCTPRRAGGQPLRRAACRGRRGARLRGQHAARHPRPLPLGLPRGAGPLGGPPRRPRRARARGAATRRRRAATRHDRGLGGAEAGAADLRLRMLRGDADRTRGRPRAPRDGAVARSSSRSATSRARGCSSSAATPRSSTERAPVAPDRAPDADRRGPGGRAGPARPGGPRRAGPGALERDLPGGVHRPRLRVRPADGPHGAPVPARAAAAGAGRRAQLHRPAPAAGARGARAWTARSWTR